MNIVVLVKQIPDPSIAGELDQDFSFKRDGKIVLDEADLYGVEIALQIRESLGSGEVSVVSMAPNMEVVGVKNALAMGADRAIVISDENLKGSHSLASAKVLSAAISKLENTDLIIAGTESSDGYSGILPAQIGALRKISVLSFATSLKVEGDTITITRQNDTGSETVNCKAPAIVSVTAGIVEPRYPNFKGILAAKSKPINFYNLSDLGIEVSGLEIDSQIVVDVEASEARSSGEIVEDVDLGIVKIMELLDSAGAI
jgi:electron transfer flavoprotein beta subunit